MPHNHSLHEWTKVSSPTMFSAAGLAYAARIVAAITCCPMDQALSWHRSTLKKDDETGVYQFEFWVNHNSGKTFNVFLSMTHVLTHIYGIELLSGNVSRNGSTYSAFIVEVTDGVIKIPGVSANVK